MPRITQEMILKKSEHHTGLLADLQEISLHQLHIERIELLGQVCRRLRILYLQNNLIPRLENLNKLKDLRYLNVALNNITRIENIDGCEKLERLDLTVNYVDIDALPDSVACLARLDFFHDLYLTGNPCTDFSDYRAFVVASLPRLSRLDGKDVTKTERLLAEQNMPLIRAHLAEAAAERVAARNAAEEKAALLERVRARAARRAGRASRRAAAAKAAATAAKAAAREPARLEEIPTATATTEDDDEEEESAAQQPQGPEDDAVADAAGAAADGPVSDDSDSDGDGLSCVDITALEKEVERAGWKYSPANRREMYLSELEEQRKREEEKQKPNERFAPAPDLVKEAYAKLNTKATEGPNGERPTQRNPARIPFSIKDSADGISCVVEIEAPKYLDTSAIDVDVHPTWLQVSLKGKLVLLHVDREVSVARARVQRVVTSGKLILTMPYSDDSVAAGAAAADAAAAAGGAEPELVESDAAAAAATRRRAAAAAAAAASSGATASSTRAKVRGGDDSDSGSGAGGIRATTERVSQRLLAERAAAEAAEIERRTSAVVEAHMASADAAARARAAARTETAHAAEAARLQAIAAEMDVDLDDLPPLD